MIHLRIFGPDEEVPKEGVFVRTCVDGEVWLYHHGGVGIVQIPDKLLPFLEELMALARKGEEAENEKRFRIYEASRTRPIVTVDRPDPSATVENFHNDRLISAIRDVGAGIMEAIGIQTVANRTLDTGVTEDYVRGITAIAERVKKP